ncbi:MAG TPA: ABC transporter substrate binding protein, partial [Blastocatellia bacterium]|nr:ABC transporter substrate binding protein [Blastocatellia bacterium]
MINALSQSIRSTLTNKSAIRIEYHTEYLDRSLIDDADYERQLVNLWRKKYHGRRIDLIFVSFASALNLLSRHSAELFPDAPTVFCVLLRSQLSSLSELGPNVTGVWAASPFRPNLELALRLHPGTQKVIVVYGSADADLLSITKSELRDFESEVEIVYLTDLTIGEYQERLANLPEHTIVLFGNLTRDREGYVFTTPESLSRIAPSSAAPIYGLTDIQLGSGIVGGSLISFQLMGTSAAEIGSRILGGEKPQDIPPQIVPNVLMFDWRELRRWGISEKSLPPGSIIEFHVPSFWDDYKWYVIGLLCVVIVQSVLIAGLVINRRRRKRVEEALRQSEDGYRDLVENSLNLICTHDLSGNLQSVNQAAADMLGFKVKELIGNNIREMLLPEARDQFDDYLARIRRDGIARGLMVVRTRSGERRVWEYINTLRTAGVDAPMVRGVAHDITERHRAEEALRESEERFRLMADALSEVIWITTLNPENVLYVSP